MDDIDSWCDLVMSKIKAGELDDYAAAITARLGPLISACHQRAVRYNYDSDGRRVAHAPAAPPSPAKRRKKIPRKEA